MRIAKLQSAKTIRKVCQKSILFFFHESIGGMLMCYKNSRHNNIYLFEMRNHKKKLAYGKTPKDALEILNLRLTAKEMEQIIQDKYCRIKKRELLTYIHQLG